MNYLRTREMNTEIEINHVLEPGFLNFGRIITDINFDNLLEYMQTVDVPESGVVYVPSNANMESFDVLDTINSKFYGEMPSQIGYCNGKNSKLNGLEFHKSSEINVAVTDLVLLLGKVQDIENNSYESSQVRAFFIPAGIAIELYATTLHFAPCKTNDAGFKCIVILPQNTNLPLNKNTPTPQLQPEAALLFAKNKWLLVHHEAKELLKRGALCGINGCNIEILY